MKIAVIGQGNTGQYVAEVAREKGHTVAEVFDVNRPLTEATDLTGVTCIDFSVAGMVPEHVNLCAKWGNNIVIGTTGWYDHLDEVTAMVDEAGIGCLYAPNFSLGVNLFFRTLQHVSQLFGGQDYDITIHEEHHTRKADAPSGTALELGKIALEGFRKKKELLFGNPDGRIREDQLQITSGRIGDVFGNHTVTLEGASDTIRLSHSIKSRRIFAEGAVTAAEWLEGQRGVYTIHDLIDSLLEDR